MAGKTAILAIRIISDATKAARELEKVETRGDRMGRRLKTAGRVASLGLLAIGAAGIKAAKAAAEDEKSQKLLANTLRRTTGARKADIAKVETWIDKTARATGVADDQLRPALDKLVGSTKNVGEAQKLLSLAMDISARTGKPLQTVSAALAKGYGGNTTALGKLVPGLSQAALKSKNFHQITKELAATTKGAAATAADTAAGKFARMQVTFGELQEQLGAFLLPILSQLAGILAQVATFVQQNSTVVTYLVAGVAALAASVLVINGAFKAYTAVTRAASVVMGIFNAVMAANPITLVVLAIAALAVGMVIAYKRSATVRNIVQAVGRVGRAAIGWVVDKVTDLIGWFGKLGPAMNKGKEVAKTAFKVYTTPIRTVIDLVKKLVSWIGKIHFPKVPGAIKKLAGAIPGLGGEPTAYALPRTAGSPGGHVSAGGRGGPDGSGFMIPVGGGTNGYAGQVNYFQIDGALDPEGVARQIERLLNASSIRNGRKPVTVR